MVSFASPNNKVFPLDGGVDLISSHFDMRPGRLVAAFNFEMIAGKKAYGRLGGYERCVGDTLPSETRVALLEIESITGSIAVDDEFLSGAILVRALKAIATPIDGDILPVATHESTLADGLVFTGTGNSFTLTEENIDTSSLTLSEIQAYRRQAIEQTRDNIDAVPGTGNNDGGFRLRGKNYVFRAGKLYEGSGYTWTEIALPEVLYFDEGTVALTVGATLTDGTATGVIASITRQEGSWDSGAATADQSKGYVTLTGVTNGPFTVGATLSDGVGGAAKVDVANVQVTLTAGGHYETTSPYNFTNLINNESVYGVDGVNDAFEFDGTNYIPIYHPDAGSKKPIHINIHQERLQLFYTGGEFAYSVSGEPRVYNALLGAGTWSTGSEIVGSKIIHGNAEAVFCGDCTWYLLGDGIYDDTTATRNWQFLRHDSNVGALEWSIAERGSTYFVSDSEIRKLIATNTSAGYSTSPILTDVQPYVSDNAENIQASIWCKKKSQYRLFFDDGKGLIASFDGGNPKGAIPIKYAHDVQRCWSATEDGKELMFFLSDTGYLYRMDSGNSFDEEYIEGSFRIPFHHYGSPRNDKRFPQMSLELDAPVFLTSDTSFTYTVNYDYGSTDSPQPTVQTVDDVEAAGGLYGSNSGYGNFVYGGPLVSEIVADLDGYGANMSVLMTYKTRYDSAFAFRNASIDFINLGIKRRG